MNGEWKTMNDFDALAINERYDQCVKCRESVRAHAQGKNASAAHVEHLKRNKKCPLSETKELSEGSMEKHICIDCILHPASSLKEVQAIPEGGYCKHLTPEYWEREGYERGWGDAAVCNWPQLEILLKQNDEESSFLILNGTLRRPVTITFNRRTGGVEPSY